MLTLAAGLKRKIKDFLIPFTCYSFHGHCTEVLREGCVSFQHVRKKKHREKTTTKIRVTYQLGDLKICPKLRHLLFHSLSVSRLAQVRQGCTLDHSCSYSSQDLERNFLPPATQGNSRMTGSYIRLKLVADCCLFITADCFLSSIRLRGQEHEQARNEDPKKTQP